MKTWMRCEVLCMKQQQPLCDTDELISNPYEIAMVAISYGWVTKSSAWDSMMLKKYGVAFLRCRTWQNWFSSQFLSRCSTDPCTQFFSLNSSYLFMSRVWFWKYMGWPFYAAGHGRTDLVPEFCRDVPSISVPIFFYIMCFYISLSLILTSYFSSFSNFRQL